MISEIQKELIALETIKVLYAQATEIFQVVNSTQIAKYNDTFFNSIIDDRFGSASLSSWANSINPILGQFFFENIGQILCDGTKKEFNSKYSLTITQLQKATVADIITDLTNGLSIPNLTSEYNQILATNDILVKATDFTADVFFEDIEEVVCVELKTVKPNKGVFKVEKQKVLEAKAALKRIYPNKHITFLIGFPFDPLSKEPCGYDKQRFMSYSVDFRKYFAENEFLLAAELWDYFSGTTQTMETILEIINSIATSDFMTEFKFLQDNSNAVNDTNKYVRILEKWYLGREKLVVENQDRLLFTTQNERIATRTFNQSVFDNNGEYNSSRAEFLLKLL